MVVITPAGLAAGRALLTAAGDGARLQQPMGSLT
jgi:hypothetical protein